MTTSGKSMAGPPTTGALGRWFCHSSTKAISDAKAVSSFLEGKVSFLHLFHGFKISVKLRNDGCSNFLHVENAIFANQKFSFAKL